MLTPCLGRERVQEALDTALATSRWVSIVGPPGSGKTLLARHAAARHPHTAWVNARGIRSADDVLTACVDALETRPAPGDSHEGAVCRALDGADTLLVVDGVDVHPDVLGPTFQRILDATTDARLAVTAVTTAGQPAERVVRVGPLPVPSAGQPLEGPAVDLFLTRVEAAGGHPVDLATHEHDVRRLLEASGGLPLLIEQIAAQIALVGPSRVVPTASVADAVHASYILLDETQQRCFRRMAQMSFPVGIDVLAEISGVDRAEATSLALALVRRSLLEVLPDGRFDMLSPVRRHGQELTEHTDDAARAREGVLRWADKVAPDHMNFGAADAPWLADLPVMRAAVLAACAEPATRDMGYALANRVFSSLYTSMRAREAVEIMEAALRSGDGPAAIGAQVARRAGIAASEARGTYEGLWLLERADQHAREAADPDLETARTASIRAEMHLDAGDLDRAAVEARRAIALDHGTDHIAPQATRTLAQTLLVRGDFAAATELSRALLTTRQGDEPWLTLSARLLLARIALEQGRRLEAATATRRVYDEARDLAEDRLALLAEVELCHIRPAAQPAPADDDSFPWAVRLPVMVAQAHLFLHGGDLARAAGRAADAVVLADSARLGRDALDARLVLGFALVLQHEGAEARATLLEALSNAATIPSPLRAADALDGLAHLAAETDPRPSRSLAATAAALRAPRGAGSVGRRLLRTVEPGGTVPAGWLLEDQLTPEAVAEVAALLTPAHEQPGTGRLDALTPAERVVADKVAEGLTSRQIAADLFLSPRTVDAHLSRIYRKLDINTRARLAALVTSG